MQTDSKMAAKLEGARLQLNFINSDWCRRIHLSLLRECWVQRHPRTRGAKFSGFSLRRYNQLEQYRNQNVYIYCSGGWFPCGYGFIQKRSCLLFQRQLKELNRLLQIYEYRFRNTVFIDPHLDSGGNCLAQLL